MQGSDNLFVTYQYNYGSDWKTQHVSSAFSFRGIYLIYLCISSTAYSFCQGLEHGMSQIARRSSGEDRQVYPTRFCCLWCMFLVKSFLTLVPPVFKVLFFNYPVEITFKSTNVHGWPQVSTKILVVVSDDYMYVERK